MEEDNTTIEKASIINQEKLMNEELIKDSSEPKKDPKKKSCYFPSAYTILIVLEFIIFILTYIIPKGKFDTIEYDFDTEDFILKIYNKTSTPIIEHRNGTQETLDELGINIKLENFQLGYIKKPISIPNSYTRLEDEENNNFFNLFALPLYGMIDSADIGFVLMMIGGCINILIEMNALTSGMEALSRVTKGHEIILLIALFVLISIGGTTFGLAEETLSFYPVLMPIFLKSGLDGALAGASLYFGSIVGVMFSTVNTFAVVIASSSAGINFVDGISFRVIGYVLGDLLVIGYFVYYSRTIKKYPEKSAVYDIRDEINKKFLKTETSDIKEGEAQILENSEEKPKKPSKFTAIQKISLILFGLCFALLVVGVIVLNWWFQQIGAIFLVLGIILMFLLRNGEQKGIEIFIKGSGDYAGVIIIIGLARGINLTLDQGLVQDTILNGLSNLVEGIPKIIFSVVMLFVFMILGFFIQSSSGLAVLSMPVFAPLADKVNCPRKVVVNAYMFGQNFISILSPTGLTLIVLQLVGMKYTHWIKFSWKLAIALLVFLIILMILDPLIE